MSFKHYPTFSEIENPMLRVWNRSSFASNLLEDKGEEESRGYLDQFDDQSRRQIMIVFRYIAVKGWAATRREVMRKVNAE